MASAELSKGADLFSQSGSKGIFKFKLGDLSGRHVSTDLKIMDEGIHDPEVTRRNAGSREHDLAVMNEAMEGH